MMAGNPNYWSMNGGMHPQYYSHQLSNSDHHQFVTDSDSNATADHDHTTQNFPVRSWSSQLLLGGLASGEEERLIGASDLFQQQKKLEENWEDDQQAVLLNLNSISNFARINNNNNDDDDDDDGGHEFHHHHQDNRSWPHHHQVMPVSSSTSCVTTLSNNFLSFSGKAAVERKNHQHNQEHSSECKSTSSGGVCKKARVQQSSAQPALKVRKEKLGDRITSLHQLVSPFGKTDTASVLSEAIGYIRFLHSQIVALSSPYMRNASVNSGHHHSDSESRGVKDLRSSGLCLVPISCTETVGSDDNGADYWAPAAALGGGAAALDGGDF